MSLADVGITLNIQNNQSYPIQMNVLGNPFNPLDTANAKIQYQFNFTTFTFTNEDSITIQYKPVGATTFSTFTQQLQSQNIQGIVNALNLLGIGSFQTYTQGGQTYVSTYNDNYVFGDINVYSNSVISGSINTTFVVGIGLNNPPNNGNKCIAIQSDGKIIVIGTFTSYDGTLANNIIRLNTNGSVDNSFVYGSGFAGAGYPNAIAIQTDGKIVVVGGFTSYNGTGANGIIRLTTTGAIDGTFVYGTGFSGLTQVNTVSIQTDGKIICGGQFTSYQGTGANRIIRLTTTGAIDATFVYGTAFSGVGIFVYGTAIQADGKIICIGTFSSYNGTSTNTAICRIDTNGSIDATFINGVGFGGGGLLNLDALSIQADGKIVVGGNDFGSYNGVSSNRIVRINTDASIDTSFVVGTGFGVGAGFGVYSLTIQNNGKIICVGNFTTYNGTSANRIIRLNSDGSVDTSFIYGVGFNSTAGSVALTSSIMYVGGSFTTYQSQSYPRIISINQ